MTFLYPDLIRSIAIFLIIVIHVAAGAFYSFSDNWPVANFFDSFSRVGVPLFFMLSGALLIPKSEPLLVFFKKRFFKVLLPLIIWSIFYLLWRIYYHHQTIQDWFILILTQPVYYHLGFINLIISVYLAAPIIRKFYPVSNNALKIYYLTLAFIAAFVAFIVTPLTGRLWVGLDLSFFSGWVAYFMLGMFLTEFNVETHRIKFLLLFLLGAMITFLLTAWWSYHSGTPNELFYNYLSLNNVFAAIGLFSFLKSFEKPLYQLSDRLKSLMVNVSKTSFGIYLIHPMILDLLASGLFGISFTAQMNRAYLSIPFVSLLCFIISFGIIFFIQKIPVVKHIVP